MKNDQYYDELVRYIFIGDSKVGKTSIIKGFTNQFQQKSLNQSLSLYQATLNLQYSQKVMGLVGKKVKIQLWDTPSTNQNFKLLLPSLYKSVNGIFLVFSVDNRNSFNSIAVWMKQIQSFAIKSTPIILVCNKADLNKKQVSQKQAYNLSEAFDLDMYLISVKKNINIEESIIKMYQKMKKVQLLEQKMVLENQKQTKVNNKKSNNITDKQKIEKQLKIEKEKKSSYKMWPLSMFKC